MVVLQVDLVACFDLFVFELVRFVLLFRLFSVFGFWRRVIGGSSFLDRLRGLLWWFVSWGVPFWLVSGVLCADRFWFEVGSKFVTQVLLGCYDVNSDRPELEWWSKLNVWSKINIKCFIDHCWWCWFLEELLLGDSAFWWCWWFFIRGFLVFLFSLFGVYLGFNPAIYNIFCH